MPVTVWSKLKRYMAAGEITRRLSSFTLLIVMPRTRIVIGFDASGPDSKPFLVYLGKSGDEVLTSMKGSAAHHFEIFEGPGRKKNNPGFDAEAVKAEVALGELTPLILKDLEELTALREKVAVLEKEKADAEAKTNEEFKGLHEQVKSLHSQIELEKKASAGHAEGARSAQLVIDGLRSEVETLKAENAKLSSMIEGVAPVSESAPLDEQPQKRKR